LGQQRISSYPSVVYEVDALDDVLSFCGRSRLLSHEHLGTEKKQADASEKFEFGYCLQNGDKFTPLSSRIKKRRKNQGVP
jgi:hypothetical protein